VYVITNSYNGETAGASAVVPEPTPAADLQEALRALVGVVDRIGGYLTSEDQAVLWRARRIAGGR
jgi:hypothetical protein